MEGDALWWKKELTRTQTRNVNLLRFQCNCYDGTSVDGCSFWWYLLPCACFRARECISVPPSTLATALQYFDVIFYHPRINCRQHCQWSSLWDGLVSHWIGLKVPNCRDWFSTYLQEMMRQREDSSKGTWVCQCFGMHQLDDFERAEILSRAWEDKLNIATCSWYITIYYRDDWSALHAVQGTETWL